MSGITRVVLTLVLLAAAAAAVQPVYRVANDVLYLPGDGLALDAHTGHLLWRFPRLDGGHVYTNGRGLLLVSWTQVIRHPLEVHFTRVCRIDAQDGHRLWCRDWADVQQWTVDGGGRFWYLHTPGRLQVVAVADGQTDRGFKLDHYGNDSNLQLLPLPQHGVLLFDPRGGGSQALALVYRPGAAALDAETLPAGIYPFRGDGRGLIFYAQDKGEFYRADPFAVLVAAPAPKPHQFPEASLDAHGFLFTAWQGANPILHGGTYGGALWDAPRPDTILHSGLHSGLHLAVTSTTAVMLAPQASSTRIAAWDLASGSPRFARTLPGDYPEVGGLGNDLVLQSATDVRLLNATDGVQRWRARGHEGPLAAISATAVVFWESGGELAALARNNGALLWRLRFQLPRPGLP